VLNCAGVDSSLQLVPPAPRLPASFELAERALALVAPLDAPVVLRGEPGSGRSVLARRLHQASRAASGPCVRVDCRGLSGRPDAARMLEDSLSAAAGGSILLEEVDALAPPEQVRLMAWLEESRGQPAAARVLSTTQRDLEAEVLRGAFREDLRSRLDVFEVRVPPLRERPGDLPALARQLAAECAARLGMAPPLLPPDVERLLLAYSWPGNVRELRSAMERAVALSGGRAIEAAALPPRVLAGALSPARS
jgi:DNA-binding NtrC family response regulator